MSQSILEKCLLELEEAGHLVRIKEEIDASLEMASVHLRVFAMKGPALLFENIKGCNFRAVSNLFGTDERTEFIFRRTLPSVKLLIKAGINPAAIVQKPFEALRLTAPALHALPFRKKFNVNDWQTCRISDLPLIKHWPMDGGAFVTLPQVYTEDLDMPGWKGSNLGMYRIQLNGNNYVSDQEIGLHYQLHRGIGVHQTKCTEAGKPMKVSIFVGGHPAHSFAAVMPLPEGLSELSFAGALAGRRFRYCIDTDGFVLSCDADFVITGEVWPGEVKPEGPFGDHLGYYSLKHDFPLMRVKKVYHRKNAIWPFTVVGRPPQEDTAFGNLIHKITGDALKASIKGLKELNAVDAAGVHPLLLAIGSERYTPYADEKKPSEILTIANHILGMGQLSLAKYLFIVSPENAHTVSAYDVLNYFTYFLERVNWQRDLHFYTQTSIDTLDYSGMGLNSGSKLVLAACGPRQRVLANEWPADVILPDYASKPLKVAPGIFACKAGAFNDYESTAMMMKKLEDSLLPILHKSEQPALLLICDEPEFVAADFSNFLWVCFTRSNPSHDVYGAGSQTTFKHWACQGPLIIDSRVKPFHAPPLIANAEVEKKTDLLFTSGHSLAGLKA